MGTNGRRRKTIIGWVVLLTSIAIFAISSVFFDRYKKRYDKVLGHGIPIGMEKQLLLDYYDGELEKLDSQISELRNRFQKSELPEDEYRSRLEKIVWDIAFYEKEKLEEKGVDTGNISHAWLYEEIMSNLEKKSTEGESQ